MEKANYNDRIKRQFDELLLQMGSLKTKRMAGGSLYYAEYDLHQWATSVQNLIGSVIGKKSSHFINFTNIYSQTEGRAGEVDSLKGIFISAKSDFEGGYIFDLSIGIAGEIFGDFISLAKEALGENSKDVAAVLACAALEDALKRFAITNNIDPANKSMQEIVNSLKSKGLVKGAQKTLLDSMPKIRNYAMHSNWDKITSEDVGSVIGFVEQFLLSHFS